MTDKEFQRNALIVGGVVLIGALLWYWADKSIAQVNGTSANNPVYPAGSPSFQTQGSRQAPGLGPFTFPVTVNQPATQPAGTLNSGNCSCGCNGSGGNTTVNFAVPGLQSLVNQLASTAAAAQQAAFQATLNTMSMPERVFVTNATNTTFSGGNPFNTYADYAHESSYTAPPAITPPSAWWAQ